MILTIVAPTSCCNQIFVCKRIHLLKFTRSCAEFIGLHITVVMSEEKVRQWCRDFKCGRTQMCTMKSVVTNRTKHYKLNDWWLMLWFTNIRCQLAQFPGENFHAEGVEKASPTLREVIASERRLCGKMKWRGNKIPKENFLTWTFMIEGSYFSNTPRVNEL